MIAVEDIFTANSDFFLDEVSTLPAVGHDITVGTSAKFNPIAQSQRNWSHTQYRKLTSEPDEAQGEEFRANLRNYSIGHGSEFVVIDETSKNNRSYARHYG